MASARTLAALASLFALAACGGGSGSSSPTPSPSPSPSPSPAPTLRVNLYGGASPGIDHLWVTVTGVAMHADAARTYGDGDAGWVTATLATPVTIDLADSSLSQGGAQQIVAKASAAAGTYAQLRLLVAPSDPGSLTASATARGLSWNEQVQYTDGSGTHAAPLELADPQAGVRLKTSFTLGGSSTTPLAIEWNAHSSLVRRAATAAGGARFTLRDELQLYDQTLLAALGGDTLTINGSLFDAILGYLDTSQFCTGSDHTGCIHDVVVSATSISADARFHEEVRSVNVGADGRFLLYPLSTTQASYDVVIHGGNMQTMVVRGVFVDPTGLLIASATPIATTSSRIVPVLDTSEHAVAVSNALSPRGSRVFFGQTIAGTGSTTTGDLPYVIAFGATDPATGRVLDTVTLPGGAIRDSSFDTNTLGQGVVPTFTAVTQKEGLGAWSVWSRGTLADGASAIATISATDASVAAPSPVRTTGFTDGTLTLTLTGTASGGADSAEAVVTNAGGTVAVVDVSGLLAQGGTTSITLPTGSATSAAGAAVYNVAVHTWTASDAFASSRWSRIAAPVSLSSTSTASASLALP
jgi:hypothetical protein